jgi:hypothetical protein
LVLIYFYFRGCDDIGFFDHVLRIINRLDRCPDHRLQLGRYGFAVFPADVLQGIELLPSPTGIYPEIPVERVPKVSAGSLN